MLSLTTQTDRLLQHFAVKRAALVKVSIILSTLSEAFSDLHRTELHS